MTPHPEHDIARRIAELGRRAPADVMVWTPLTSASGKWEAAGDGWEIAEADPSRFHDRLKEKLATLQKASSPQ